MGVGFIVLLVLALSMIQICVSKTDPNSKCCQQWEASQPFRRGQDTHALAQSLAIDVLHLKDNYASCSMARVSSTDRHVFIVDTPHFRTFYTHNNTMTKVLDGFRNIGCSTGRVTSFDDIPDSPKNIFLMQNAISDMNEADTIREMNLLAGRFPESTFVLWFFHAYVWKNQMPFKRFIITGEHFYGEPAGSFHNQCYRSELQWPFYVSIKFSTCMLRAELKRRIEAIKSDLTVSKDYRYDSVFIGCPYKASWSSELTNCYYDASYSLTFDQMFLRYQESLVALGFHADDNIANHVIVERIFDTIAYGCILVTDHPDAVSLFGEDVATFVANPADVNAFAAAIKAMSPMDVNMRRITGMQKLLDGKMTYEDLAERFISAIDALYFTASSASANVECVTPTMV